jgi:hypothetical protein
MTDPTPAKQLLASEIVEATRVALLEFHGFTQSASDGSDYRDEARAAVEATLPVIANEIRVRARLAAKREGTEPFQIADFIERGMT